jgi:uncharacterized damage-inducible protein DinB
MRAFTLPLAIALFGVAALAAEPTITKEERAHVIKLLKDSQAEFLGLVSGLTDAQWTYQPAPDRWSVGQTAEHIVLAEGLLFSKMEEALANPPNPDWEAKTRGKTEFIERVMPDRSHKAQAPEPVQPHAQWTREETIARYKEQRARTLKFIEETDLPLKSHTSEHPFPVFNTLNAYQWLLYIPLHNMRHDQQIVEVKGSAGFPH